jgi:signal transduction histidine kinase/CheY-like chemotaxis protein
MSLLGSFSIRLKLVTVQLLTAFCVLVIACALFVARELDANRDKAVQRYGSAALLLGESSLSALTFLDSDSARRTLASLAVEPDIRQACLYDGTGEIFASYTRAGLLATPFPEPLAGTHHFADGQLLLFQGIARDGQPMGVVFLVVELDEWQQISGFLLTSLLVLGFGLLLSILLALFFQKGISGPILHLTEAARRVSQTGDYQSLVARESNDEVGELCDGFNEMLKQIALRDADLREAQSVLEGRVEERTADLSLANASLQTQIEQRRKAQETIEDINQELVLARDKALEANRAKSVFLANMSHEIRTPMNAILGYAQILQDQADLSSQDRHAVDTIRRSGDSLLALINDVLDISKIEAGRIELTTMDFGLAAMITSLSTMFQLHCADKELQWKTTSTIGAGEVHGDANKLLQVLTNLLGNAVKFCEQGSVSLDVDHLARDRYRFVVTDTGPGIDPSQHDAIFEPFQQDTQTAIGGTGLGLAIARQHVDMMGGRLQVASTPGEGSAFSFELDLPQAEGGANLEAQPWTQTTGLSPGQEVSALVVDDLVENREVLGFMLGHVGCQVDYAEDGLQAVAAARRGGYDIIFMDIRMPNLDGTQARARIAEALGDDCPKIVAVTASAFNHQRQQFLDDGFDEFIDKPFRKEAIFACLGDVLGARFEFAGAPTPATQAPTESQQSLWREALSDGIRQRLMDAAAQHNASGLRNILAELAAAGGASAAVAGHLSEITRGYNMTAIQNWLAEVE